MTDIICWIVLAISLIIIVGVITIPAYKPIKKEMIKFELQESEEKAARKFMEEHKDCSYERLHKPFYSTTGGQFSFIITPTGLGSLISIRCNACDKIEEITDSSNW